MVTTPQRGKRPETARSEWVDSFSSVFTLLFKETQAMRKLTTTFAAMALVAALTITVIGSPIRPVGDEEGSAVQGGQTGCSGYQQQQFGCGAASCTPKSSSTCQTIGIWNGGGTSYGTVSNGTANCYACGGFTAQCGQVNGNIYWSPGCGS